MNRRDALTTVALAGAAIAAASGSAKADAPASTLDRIKKNGVLRVAVIVGQEPYFHKDLATNEWSGACIDMAKDIAGKLGAKVETLESTWGNQILDLQADKVDLAFAVNPTPERALVIDFSTPILVHSFTVITKKGFAKPQTWAELNKPEVKIAVDIGSTHETIAPLLPEGDHPRLQEPRRGDPGGCDRPRRLQRLAGGAFGLDAEEEPEPRRSRHSAPAADAADQHGHPRRERPPLQGFPQRLGRLQPRDGPDPRMDAQGF